MGSVLMNNIRINTFSKSFYFSGRFNQSPLPCLNVQNNIPYRNKNLLQIAQISIKSQWVTPCIPCFLFKNRVLFITFPGVQKKLWLSRWSCPDDQQLMQIVCVSGRVEIPLFATGKMQSRQSHCCYSVF